MSEQIKKIQKIMCQDKKSVKMMIFGKYAGEDLSDIPLSYLRWLLGRGIDLSLEECIEIEIERRGRC